MNNGGDVIAAATAPTTQTETVPAQYDTITDMDHLQQWISRLQSAPYFALDTETGFARLHA
ncbi:MAG: hypothetical protein R3E61_09265 [Pseudomonadales bacterium]